jgi:hypothetical protein
MVVLVHLLLVGGRGFVLGLPVGGGVVEVRGGEGLGGKLREDARFGGRRQGRREERLGDGGGESKTVAWRWEGREEKRGVSRGKKDGRSRDGQHLDATPEER